MDNILLITTRNFKVIGGVERYILNLIEYFSRSGIPLRILAPETAIEVLKVPASVEIQTFPDNEIPKKNFFRFLNPFKRQEYLCKVFKKHEEFMQADIVLTRDVDVAAAFANVYKNIPLIFIPGSLLKLDLILDQKYKGSVFYRFSRWLQNKAKYFVEKTAFKRASKICVFSEALKKRIIENYTISSLKITILPMGTNLSLHENPENIIQGKIFMVGRLARSKNFELAIEAMKELDGYHLYIAGEGEHRLALEKQIQQLSLQNKITLLGHKTDLKTHYLDCAIFLHLAYYENFGQVLLEAMSYGKPPIVLNPSHKGVLTASAEFIADGFNGFFVDNFPLDVVKKIEEVSNLPLKNFIKPCHECVASYSFCNHQDRLFEVLREVIR